MASKYITTNVRIPKSVHSALKHRAVEEGVSLGEVIRRSIFERMLEKNKRSGGKKKGISTLRDLRRLAEPLGGDLSASVDEIVYGKGSR